ncbi:DUF402 domain-containing protein [Thermoactinomyces sp. DSM 45892]|uniref:DUF402 domain-containing protein n=1 Tax=Thermoactinomyces sp. DSM 45892 TaxID=1882753 RepID=UPI0008943609|nr:DUF402 domain-containing protein [Thermoactinomyces sp. DSM 45892]SDY89168.1 hypothetical protein SAMN05444416_109188 [Thermoactinomyces sp. DSM 45892]
MKRKQVTMDEWERIECKKTEIVHRLDSTWARSFCIMQILEVREPLVIEEDGEEICLIDKGYTRIQHVFPSTPYAISTFIDRENKVVEWYIDICKQVGWDRQQIPWYDDLFLDVVIYPSLSKLVVLDEEELEEARLTRKISQEEYEFAWRVLKDLMNQYYEGSLSPLLNRCYQDFLEWQNGSI